MDDCLRSRTSPIWLIGTWSLRPATQGFYPDGMDISILDFESNSHHFSNLYWNRESRLTRGFVEGLNTKIRVLTRRCFGLFNLQHFFQRLWLEGYRLLA